MKYRHFAWQFSWIGAIVLLATLSQWFSVALMVAVVLLNAWWLHDET